MSTTHPNSSIPADQHLWEVEPRRIVDGVEKRGRMIQAAAGNHPDAQVIAARAIAEYLLVENADLDSVGIYHTYPNAGPVRRYVGLVRR